MMTWKDKRIKIMSEILKGIRTIKFHSWEKLFINKVLWFRKHEIKYLKYRKYLDALCVYFWATTPVIISSLVFATYVYFHGSQGLISSKVFTTLALLGMLIMPLNALPWVLNGLMESLVSLKRLNQFYILTETDFYQNFDSIEEEEETIFELDNCSFTYDDIPYSESDNFTLSNIDFKIAKHTFVGLTGKVGSGKSSLIKSLLNELNKTNGIFKVNKLCNRGIGCVLQESWIQNSTIRENILFGKEYDPEWYIQTIDACELFQDFQLLPKGDQTQIGNHGATLSGGQKARITLARALYQNFDVYLVDEPFSSIDRNVAHQIYQKCFRTILKNKCVILVTNHIEYLQEVLTVLYLDHGKLKHSILSADLYKNLVESNLEINQTHQKNEQLKIRKNEFNEDKNDEEREHGKIKFNVYLAYISSIGYCIFSLIILSICLMQISKTASDLWLSLWTQNENSSQTMTYLYIFISIGIVNSIVTLIRAFLFAYGGVRAAVRTHNLLLNSLFKSSTLFFDMISYGIIMNRFSSDMFNVDDALPFTLNIFLAQLSSLIISLLITVYGMPWVIFIFLLLVIPYYFIQEYFRTTSRELKRISATSLSPIYSQLDDTIQGLTIIRSFAQIERFKKEFYEKVNIYNRVQYSISAIQQWLNLRLQFIGTLITSSVAFIAVFIHYYKNQQVSSSWVGLSLVYSLSLTSLLNGSVQAFTQTELDLISVERIKQLIRRLKEFQEDKSKGNSHVIISDTWPNEGVICFKNVSMRYRDDLAYVLRDISFEIKAGEHIAIVGRTGSGKSSIFQALLRLVNIESGSITVDGIDTQSIDLKILRSRVYTIPQDVFMFNGTIRENLDPLNQYQDSEIWTALFDCKINILVDSMGGLYSELHESGKDLSIGQKHLFCLARAVLNKSRILCMDEITANIDDETGLVLEELMGTVFKETTILHITHKVEAIRNYDRIIVMNEGSIVDVSSFEQYAASINSSK